MSIINWFNKPKWKNKDAEIRALAVSSDDSPELIAQLPNISQNDESAKVRSAAVKRIKDYSIIALIAENDKNNEVRLSAQKILQDWFINQEDNSQYDILQKIKNNSVIEFLAQHAKDITIRKYCIQNISKQGLLGDLLISEKDKKLRNEILDKINKPATLKRILKTVKSKDKNIFHAIQAKLTDDKDAIIIVNQKAMDLCEQMEKMIHNPANYNIQDVESINQKWKELIQDHDLEQFTQRFEGAYRTAGLTLDPEKRDEFISSQRKQRIENKIKELKDVIDSCQHDSWEQIQTQIGKFSGFDLQYAENKQKTEFEELLQQLKSMRDAQSKKQDLSEELISVVDQLDAVLKQKYNQPRQISQFRKLWDEHSKKSQNSTAYSTLKARFDKSMLILAEKIEKSANLRDEAAKNAIAGIDNARKLIKEGHLSDAKIAINKIAKNKKIAGAHPLMKKHKFEFDTVWNELRELRQWQKWSNDKIRLRMIEELRSLIGTGTHPDALLKKMKEANKQWKELEDHEKLEGDRYNVRNQELYTQFRQAQKELFEPAQKFFEKRSEIWGKELEQLENEIQQLHEVDLKETSDRDLARQVRNALKHLRNLDKIPPGSRGKCASSIRSGIDRIDAHLQESYKVATRRKEKLIDMANELIEHENLEEAIEQAKSLQQEWKTAGIVQQNTERKLWKAFRKANDSIFNRLKQQKDQEKKEHQAAFSQAETLIDETEKAIKSEKSAQSVHSIIERFKDDWSSLKTDNRNLQRKAQKLIESGEQKVSNLTNNENVKSLKDLQKFADICQKLESGNSDKETANEQWSKLKPLTDNKLMQKMQNRLDNSENSNPDYAESASKLLIASEYLTGLATPDEFKEQRLSYQVEELSKRMSGEDYLDPVQQSSQLLKEWFTLQGADPGFYKANEKRIKKVIKALFDLVKG